MKTKSTALDDFSSGLRLHIEKSLNQGVPPEFMVMRLELNKVELANMHIATVRRQQEIEEREATVSSIVGVNGQRVAKGN